MKMTTRNAERCPRHFPHSDGECPHVRLMREDDKSHDLWIAGHIFAGRNLVLLQCDDCAAEMDSTPEFNWRLPYRIMTMGEAKGMVRADPSVVAISELAKRIEQEAFEDDKPQS
jgi:hypothetical protein